MSQAPAEGLSIFTRTAYQKLRDREGYPGSRPPWGTLNALDLNSGRIVWRVPLGRYQALIDKGLPLTGTENMGGPMVTAGGLVFVSGTKDLLIRAFDSESGKVLWEHALPFVGSASPMTYEHKGQQFIVIPATGGGTLALYDSRVATGGSFVAFRLGDTPIGVTN
jgi:quinoprotein glucose dehydrogenase